MYGTIEPAHNRGRRASFSPVIVDVSAGVVAFLVVGVTSVSFAFATFASSFPELVGDGARMALVGIVVVGAVELAKSRAPYMIVSPDLFVCPMLCEMGRALDANGATYAAAAIVATGCSGLALVAAGKSALLRLGDFVPFPIVCGLLGAVGVVLLRESYAIATMVVVSDGLVGVCPMVDHRVAVLYAPAIVFGLAAIGLNARFGGSPTRSTLPLLVGATLMFYCAAAIAARWGGADQAKLIREARACGFLFDPSVLRSDAAKSSSASPKPMSWESLLEWARFDAPVDWAAICSISVVGRILALCLLVVVKSSLMYPAWERALREHFSQPLELGRELVAIGAGNTIAALVGSFGAQPQLSTAVSLREMGARPIKGLSALTVVVLCLVMCLVVDGAAPLAVVPKFAFAGLLIAQGWVLVQTFVVEPCCRSPRVLEVAESSIVILIIFVFVCYGMLAGLSVGAQFSVLLFAAKSHGVGVFKYQGSAALQRSTTQRSPFACRQLDTEGHLVQILQLHGLLYWGNATQLLRSVRLLLFKGVDDAKSPPRCVVLDFALVLDLDASAAEAVLIATELCQSKDCQLVLSGCNSPSLSSRLRRAGLDLRYISPDDARNRAFSLLSADDDYYGDDASLKLRRRTAWIADNLDDALAVCEDALLDQTEGYCSPRPPRQNEVGYGFSAVLINIARRCGPGFVDVSALARLEPQTRVVKFEPGDHVFTTPNSSLPFGRAALDEDDGIAFVESGVVAIRREPDQAPGTCLGAGADNVDSPVFRMVRLGPGGVVGLPELFSGRRSIGAARAETKCIAHILQFKAIKQLRRADPSLALQLYRTLAHLLALAYDERSDKFARTLDMMHSIPRSEIISTATRFRAERAVLGRLSKDLPVHPSPSRLSQSTFRALVHEEDDFIGPTYSSNAPATRVANVASIAATLSTSQVEVSPAISDSTRNGPL